MYVLESEFDINVTNGWALKKLSVSICSTCNAKSYPIRNSNYSSSCSSSLSLEYNCTSDKMLCMFLK